MTPALYLASTSPRRCELLNAAELDYTVVAPGPEPEGHGTPLDRANLRARSKALGALVPPGCTLGVVLGVDTVVDLDGRELGKPADRAAAEAMLRELSGREHLVHTAHCIRPHPATPTWLVERTATARVRCARLGPEQIAAYLDSGQWEGKAGAYGIQGLAGQFCAVVDGDFDVVVGLSVAAVRALLGEAGAPLAPGAPRA